MGLLPHLTYGGVWQPTLTFLIRSFSSISFVIRGNQNRHNMDSTVSPSESTVLHYIQSSVSHITELSSMYYETQCRTPPIRAQNISSFNRTISFQVRSSHVASPTKGPCMGSSSSEASLLFSLLLGSGTA